MRETEVRMGNFRSSADKGGRMASGKSRTGIRRFVGYSGILLVVLLFGCFAWAQTDHVPKEGDRAPNFSITTDQDKQITPTAFGGNLLVLNFWETACVPCVKELPSLSDFARAFRPQGVVVVAVSGDADPQKYGRFLSDHHIALETYRDPSRRISQSFGTYMFPETYIIQHGRVVRKVEGGIDWMSDDIASFVRTRLAHQ
jgi:cytochrome c biogenesis protein CcmG/thiol:disulfide interchange protein DsbE